MSFVFCFCWVALGGACCASSVFVGFLLDSSVFTGAMEIEEPLKKTNGTKKTHDKRRKQYARPHNDNEGLWFANETIK